MKTIIVPVDFSPASLNAANYALDLALAVKASIALFHVYTFPMPVSEVPVAPLSIQELLEDAEKNMQELKEGLQHKAGEIIKIYTRVEEGLFATQLQQYCHAIQPYAVVMGSFGKSALERVIFGSNTVAAMKHLSAPLLIVPPGTRFTRISRIGLACDLLNVTQSVHAEKIVSLVKEFSAQLHVLHITPARHGFASDEAMEGSEWLREMLEEVKPVFHFMQHSNVEEAINEFSEKNNLDMLIIIPKSHGLLDGLLHRSHSKQMILQAHIPVMSIHE